MKAELIDVMGDDIRVANAARVSFDKNTEWENADVWEEGMEPILKESDQRIINYLAKHNHWTPFSHVMITMRETVPIFVARQRFKHMVGFTYNEISRRYVSDEPTFFTPDAWRKAAENKKQGSSDEVIENLYDHINGEEYGPVSHAYELHINSSIALYEDMINSGVAPEQARMILPQSMYTSYYVTGSLSAWARAYKLRSDEHSQKEIQDLAHQWGDIIGSTPGLNYSWKALTNV